MKGVRLRDWIEMAAFGAILFLAVYLGGKGWG